MSLHQHNSETALAEAIPALYIHKGRVCAHELEHELGVKPVNATGVMTTIESRGWVTDPLAHAHSAAELNHPSYLFNKQKVRTDHLAAKEYFRKLASPSLVQVMVDTISSRADILRGVDNPFSAVTYHGGIAVLAAEHDLSSRQHWLGGVPGWTSFVDLALISTQRSANIVA